MREIKFRAWDKLHKRLADVASIDFLSGVAMLDDSEDIWRIGFGDIVMEQYTGLHDKNGKGVYEGDIDLADSKIYSRVVWKKGGFWITWPGREKPLEAFLTPEMDNMMNIVGNIHENADLLEVPR